MVCNVCKQSKANRGKRKQEAWSEKWKMSGMTTFQQGFDLSLGVSGLLSPPLDTYFHNTFYCFAKDINALYFLLEQYLTHVTENLLRSSVYPDRLSHARND